MANIYIETQLKTIIDAISWTGLTDACYIWAESASIGLDLDHIYRWNTTSNKVIWIIHPSKSQIINQTSLGKTTNFIGKLVLYGQTVANIKTAFNDLKTKVDATPELNIHGMHGAINGDPKNFNYWAELTYDWDYFIAD